MAPPPWSRREVRAVLLALALLGLIALVDGLVGGRTIPLSAVLLAPLLSSAVCGPVPVGLLVVAALAVGTSLGLADGLPPTELLNRLVLIAVAGLFSTGVAVARGRRERQLARADRVAALADTLQRGLLPRTRASGAVRVATVYRPGHRDLLLGGDFIDVLTLDDGAVGFCVGDVSGHGAAAAALGSALRAGWRTQALAGTDPAAWLAAMDRLLVAEVESDEMFATVVVGRIEAGGQHAELANAGHPQPVLLTDTAELVPLKAGPPLGMPTGLSGGWNAQQVTLGVRWALMLYTDGLVEGRRAPGSTARYGDHSLSAWLGDSPAPHRVTRDDLDRLLSDVEAANGQPLEDDVAIVLLSAAAP